MKSLPLLLILMSCSSFPTGRSYLSEMSREDRGLLEPHRDFPVVMGDTGAWGYTDEVRRLRTPASAAELEEYDLEQSLQWELAQLEGELSPQDLASYSKYSAHLPTISERIYFLKIPLQERHAYLESRGIIPSHSSSWRPLNRGMSKNEVVSLLGRPQRVDIAGSASMENERWLYAEQGELQYVYFESGKVGGWE